jgi:hypothetical protein
LASRARRSSNAIRDNAKETFDTIVDGARAGTAAQEDVVWAFKAYADAATAAAADSSQLTHQQVAEQLAVQASVLGIPDALGKAGNAGKKASDDTAQSFDNAKGPIDQAKDSTDEFGDTAKKADDSPNAVAE